MKPLTDKLLRAASADLERLAPGDLQLAARVVGETLLEHAAMHSLPDAASLAQKLEDAGATQQTASLGDVRPFEALAREAPTERERAVLSALLARHLRALDERGEERALEDLLPHLDWLELHSPYAPYSAARATLEPRDRKHLAAVAGRLEAGTERARAALRSLRGDLGATADDARTIEQPMDVAAMAQDTERDAPTAPTLAGELEGNYRGTFARVLGSLTGWGLLRGAVLWGARLLFSYKRPVTMTLERDVLRIVGHTELLGRTLREVDLRFPLEGLAELRREVRYPALPAALGALGLGVGALLGARAVVEGAGVVYFPLIALGFGFLLGGLLFEFVLRALFPGVQGRVRLVLRSRSAESLELAGLDAEELDKLLTQAERRVGSA